MIRYELKQELNKILELTNNEQYSIEEPPQNIDFDFATNILAVMSKKLKKSPQSISSEIIRKINANSELIESAVFSPPCFINFNINKQRLYREMQKVFTETDKYPVMELGKSQSILVEFVSSNPTGPLHIGHGRCAAMGDTLSRIFTQLGFDVKREYYINNIGNQIQSLAGSVMEKCEEHQPGFLSVSEKEWLGNKVKDNFYKGSYIKDIAIELINELGANKQLLAARAANFLEFYSNYSVNKIMGWIEQDMELFRVKFDYWSKESDLYVSGEVDKMLKLLEEKKLAEKRDGALWFKSTQLGDEKDRVLVRQTGEKTYFASDIAYHAGKYRKGYSKLINIWGADHHGYVSRIKNSMKALGFDDTKLEIILYQLVSLLRNNVPVTMSTRAGEFVTLKEVINEIGADATRYFLVTRTPNSTIQFDLELAKKKSLDNPVYYIQYAHTRCCGILREAEKQFSADDLNIRNCKPDLLVTAEEHEIISQIAFYQDILCSCYNSLTPHLLVTYLLSFANLFHTYYAKSRVITEDMELSKSRLLLIKSIRIIISNGLNLLGVSAPEKM